MPSGPSKQELEMYWTNSRQYFDQLAEHYKQADPAYYKEYIEPFYNNPFHTASSSSGGKSSGCGAKMILVIAVFMVLAVCGAGIFYLLYNTSSDKESDPTGPKPNQNIEKKIEPTDNNKDGSPEPDKKSDTGSDPDGLSPEDNFIIGSKALGDKDYDKAEKHLKKIKPGDKYYKEAQQILESIPFLRKYDK